MQGKFPLVLVVNSQPGFALVLDLYQYEYVRLLKPTLAAQDSLPSLLLLQLMLYVPFLASLL